jgi:glycosyltransferase involved in cell wall biosynthesis
MLDSSNNIDRVNIKEANHPVVSVIIPTRNRHQLIKRAVMSALNQTFKSLEVLTIIDGKDPATVTELSQIKDRRLRTIELDKNIGAAGVRNKGIELAKGEYIAFLDDDDIWLPQKIERQLQVAQQSTYRYPIVSSRFRAITAKGEFIWPTRIPQASESVGEYLFIRNSWFKGESYLATPTILLPKQLVESIRFNENLFKYEDYDLLLKISQVEGAGLEFVDEPMAIVNAIDLHTANRHSLSNIYKWKYSLDWLHSIERYLTRRAYSGFIVTHIAPEASASSQWQAFLPLLWKAYWRGKPRLFDGMLYLIVWFFPQELRQQIRQLFSPKFNPH